MANLTLDFLLDHVGEYALPYPPDSEIVFTSIVNDSRQARPGSLFLALEAERDGHAFIAAARAAGAIGVLARRAIPLDDWLAPQERGGFAYVRVPDVLAGVQRVAAAHRDQLAVGVIGVVGSVGKTTTKEVVAQVLRRHRSVLASPGNFNNEIGLPIALFELTGQHDRAVLEMGAYHIGEIADLCRIAQPQVAVLTTLGPTHLESFGSMAAIEQAKGEIVDYLSESGLAVLNGDDERVRRMEQRARCPVVFYGQGEGNLVRATDLVSRGLDGIAFRLHYPGGSVQVETPLIGQHSVYPCLAAAAVALADDIDGPEIAAALAEEAARPRLKPLAGRNDSTILDDSYNAAPISVAAALEVLAGHRGRRIAILGDMLELGELEVAAHREVGQKAAAAVDLLIVVGRRARDIGAAAEAAGLAAVAYAERGEDVDFEPAPGDLVLVKASRGMRLETVVARLVEPAR